MYDEPGWARVASAVVLRRSLAECRVGAEPYTRSAIVRRTKNSHRKLRAWIQIWPNFDHLCFDSIGEYSDFWWHEVAEKKLHKYGPTMELGVYRKKKPTTRPTLYQPCQPPHMHTFSLTIMCWPHKPIWPTSYSNARHRNVDWAESRG